MDTVTLKAETRTGLGKGVARKIRALSKIPATIYRSGQLPTLCSVDSHEFGLVYEKSKNPNTLLSIQVGDQTVTAILKDAQRHPVSRKIEHIDFYQVLADQPVIVEIPLRVIGRAAGITLGGQLRVLRRSVKMRCLPHSIPVFIEIDVTPLKVDDFVRASQIPAPANCSTVFEHDYAIVTISGKRSSDTEVTDAAPAAPAAAAPAAPAAKGGGDKKDKKG